MRGEPEHKATPGIELTSIPAPASYPGWEGPGYEAVPALTTV